MGLTLNSNNKTTRIFLAPLNGIITIVRWFSIGLFKSFSFIISYLLDLLSYAIYGMIIFFKKIFTAVISFFKYEFLGIWFLLSLLGTIFYYMTYGIKFVFYDPISLLIKYLKTTFRIIGDKAKSKDKSKFKDKLNNIAIIKSLNNRKLAEKGILFIDPDSAEAKRSDTLQIYRYLAKDKLGKLIRGSFYGYSKLDVNSYLINEGFEVYEIETSKWINFYYGKLGNFSSKLKNKDLTFWLQQLATYIKSGIPLTTAVRILGNQMGKSSIRKRLFDSIVYELSMGESFSKALEKQTGSFPGLLINMIKAAEATGELEETLFEMADYYREVEKTRKQMISAITYPAVILTFAIGVLTFIVLYVVPQFQGIYTQSGMNITGTTLLIINISKFLQNNVWYVLAGIIGVITIIVFLYKNIKSFRIIFQTITMKIPILGKIIIYKEMMIFTKTFASLLKNNVYITESIDILSKITKNEIYKDIMFNTITNIAKGDKISDAFKDHWAIPEVAYYMIVTGESTGELAQMMTTVSAYYQELHTNSVNSLKALIEPVLILLLGVIVGVVILSVIIPMFDLYSSIEM